MFAWNFAFQERAVAVEAHGDSELEVVFSKYSLSCRDGENKHVRHFACLVTQH